MTAQNFQNKNQQNEAMQKHPHSEQETAVNNAKRSELQENENNYPDRTEPEKFMNENPEETNKD